MGVGEERGEKITNFPLGKRAEIVQVGLPLLLGFPFGHRWPRREKRKMGLLMCRTFGHLLEHGLQTNAPSFSPFLGPRRGAGLYRRNGTRMPKKPPFTFPPVPQQSAFPPFPRRRDKPYFFSSFLFLGGSWCTFSRRRLRAAVFRARSCGENKDICAGGEGKYFGQTVFIGSDSLSASIGCPVIKVAESEFTNRCERMNGRRNRYRRNWVVLTGGRKEAAISECRA